MDVAAIVGLVAAGLSVLAALVAAVRSVRRWLRSLQARLDALERAMRVHQPVRFHAACLRPLAEGAEMITVDAGARGVVVGRTDGLGIRVRLAPGTTEVLADLRDVEPAPK